MFVKYKCMCVHACVHAGVCVCTCMCMLAFQVHPQRESYWGHVNPIGPRACYDEGKRVSETMFYAYAHQDGVDVRVARIFNTYGPRMHMNDGRVVSNFIIQALEGNPLTVS